MDKEIRFYRKAITRRIKLKKYIKDMERKYRDFLLLINNTNSYNYEYAEDFIVSFNKRILNIDDIIVLIIFYKNINSLRTKKDSEIINKGIEKRISNLLKSMNKTNNSTLIYLKILLENYEKFIPVELWNIFALY